MGKNPARFELYLSGSAETNQLKSELVRRVRLHRLAEIYILMMSSDIPVYRDLKPDVFAPSRCPVNNLTTAAFYTSREIKQMKMETVKISGSRMAGVLLTADSIYITYNGGSNLIKMDYRAEQRAKALLTSTLCYERLSSQYRETQVTGIMIGKGLDLFTEILSTSDVNARCFFLKDGSYEHFFYLTNDHYGEVLLKLLCSSAKRAALNRVLMQGLQPQKPEYSIVNDAIDAEGNPVLWGYLLDIPRINRFCNGLELHEQSGTIFCFDFQAEALTKFCGSRAHIQPIRFDMFERSFFIHKK